MESAKTAPLPPIVPMLARLAAQLPTEPGFLFEPKWDGIRALVFRSPTHTYLQGRDLKPLERYFPELQKALHELLPKGCVLDGEIVVAGPRGLDHETLQRRIDPSASRVARMARDTPAAYVAFDLLAAGGKSTLAVPQSERRARLERLLGRPKLPLVLTPMTREREQAQDWLQRFAGAGLDGVIARPESAAYQPGKRTLLKVKHMHTADCVVMGLRWHKGHEDTVGSLLLGLYDADGVLEPVGVVSAFTMELRRELAQELQPLRVAEAAPAAGELPPEWVALRPGRVVEVRFDQAEGGRLRNEAQFLRWRADKPAQECGIDQLAVTAPGEVGTLFGG